MVIKREINLINFFFPRFSEKELVSLCYLIFLSGIHQWKSVLSLAFMSMRLFFFLIGVALAMAMVFYHAIRYSHASQVEKQFFAYSFYIILSIISIYSLSSLPDLNSINNRRNLLFDFMEIIEFIIIIYIFLKSFLRIIIMRFAPDETSHHIANQMKNEQLRVIELVLIILFAPVIYLLIQPNNSIPQVLCLSYFYLSTLITISEKISRKYFINK